MGNASEEDILDKAIDRVIRNAKKLINHKDKDNIIITETIRELKPKIEKVNLLLSDCIEFDKKLNEYIKRGWTPIFETFQADDDWFYILVVKYKVEEQWEKK